MLLLSLLLIKLLLLLLLLVCVWPHHVSHTLASRVTNRCPDTRGNAALLKSTHLALVGWLNLNITGSQWWWSDIGTPQYLGGSCSVANARARTYTHISPTHTFLPFLFAVQQHYAHDRFSFGTFLRLPIFLHSGSLCHRHLTKVRSVHQH
jgi:hypothetical protein